MTGTGTVATRMGKTIRMSRTSEWTARMTMVRAIKGTATTRTTETAMMATRTTRTVGMVRPAGEARRSSRGFTGQKIRWRRNIISVMVLYLWSYTSHLGLLGGHVGHAMSALLAMVTTLVS